MTASNHPGRILPQDTAPGDGNEEVIAGQAVSFAEVADLLYGDDRSVEQRVARLRELADEVRPRTSGGVADDDARGLLDQIEDAIEALDSTSDGAGEPGMLAEDARDHRETLSPDSDELEEIEGEDEDSLSDLRLLDGEEQEPDDPDQTER